MNSAEVRLSDAQQRVATTVGREVLAPVLADFARWIHASAQRDGVSRILFLARDGFMIQAAYEAIIPPPDQLPHQYIFASRRLYFIASIDHLGERELEMLAGDRVAMPVSQYLQRIGLKPSDCEAEVMAAGFWVGTSHIVTLTDRQKLKRVFKLLELKILVLAERERQRLDIYLDGVADWFKDKCGVVDIGWHGSLQVALSAILQLDPHAIKGYYFGLRQRTHQAGGLKYAYVDERLESHKAQYQATIMRSMELLEILFAETKGSMVGLARRHDTFVAIREHDEAQMMRSTLVGAIHAAALDELNHRRIWPPRDEALAQLARLMSWPTLEEAEVLGDMIHQEGAGGFGHKYPLALPSRSSFWYLLSPWALVSDIRSSWWQRGLMRRVLGAPLLRVVPVRPARTRRTLA